MVSIIIKYFILLIYILLLAFGFLHEDKLAAWERRTAVKIKRKILQSIAILRRYLYGILRYMSDMRGKSRSR